MLLFKKNVQAEVLHSGLGSESIKWETTLTSLPEVLHTLFNIALEGPQFKDTWEVQSIIILITIIIRLQSLDWLYSTV